MKNVKMIGIAGGSGSGKTRLVKNILSAINNTEIISLEVDSYYRDLSHLTFNKRCQNNFDHPDSMDFELLYDNLKRIINNESVETPLYDYERHTRKKNEFNTKMH